MDLFITAVLIAFLFALLASGLWIGLALLGIAWIDMELFTSRPVFAESLMERRDFTA